MSLDTFAQVNEVLEKNKPHIIEALYAFEKGDIKKMTQKDDAKRLCKKLM